MFLNQRSELSSHNIGDFSYAGPDFQVLTWGRNDITYWEVLFNRKTK